MSPATAIARCGLLVLALLLAAACAQRSGGQAGPAEPAIRYDTLALGVRTSENTSQALDLVRKRYEELTSYYALSVPPSASLDVNMAPLLDGVRETLEKIFRSVVRLDEGADPRGKDVQVTMLMDIQVELGRKPPQATTIEVKGTFTDPAGKVLGTAQGLGKGEVAPFGASSGFQDAAAQALKSFTASLGTSKQLRSNLDLLAGGDRPQPAPVLAATLPAPATPASEPATVQQAVAPPVVAQPAPVPAATLPTPATPAPEPATAQQTVAPPAAASTIAPPAAPPTPAAPPATASATAPPAEAPSAVAQQFAALAGRPPGRRIALVIGNSAYPDAPLRNTVNDANDMAATLQRLGFQVILRTNAGLRDMETALDDFHARLKRGGTGLFYFSGHGMQVHGSNYLVPLDARIATESDARYQAMDAGRVLGKMEDAGNELNIVILDACRSNPFGRGFRSYSQGLARMDAPTGSLIAYATAPGSVASDGAGRNGTYTKHLLQHLDTPGLAITDLFMLVRMGVVEETDKTQVPWESSSLTGYFYFQPSQ